MQKMSEEQGPSIKKKKRRGAELTQGKVGGNLGSWFGGVCAVVGGDGNALLRWEEGAE